MAVNWSNLLPEMLENIAEKSMSMNLKDFVMFSCVCSSWHRAASFVKSTRVVQPRMPWLVLPDDRAEGEFDLEDDDDDDEDDDHDDKRNLFDVCNNKCYNLSLPQAYKRRCHGTGSEWLLMVGLDREIHLFNPLTQALLPLPSYKTFLHPIGDDPEDEDEDEDEEDYREYKSEWLRLNCISRACVLTQTCYSNSWLVVVIYGIRKYVAVATQKDTKWMPIDVRNVCDVAYTPSSGRVLFLHHTGHVKYCDLHHLYGTTMDTNVPLSVLDYNVVPPPRYIGGIPFKQKQVYILESFGDILMVRQIYIDTANFERDVHTCDFNVYKLDMRTNEWKEVLDLGDVALFIGNGPTTSVKTSSFPTTSCKPNSIYFNEDGLELPFYFKKNTHGHWTMVYGGRDMGVFNLADKSIQSFYHGHDCRSEYSFPAWLVPKL